jgi:glutaredoxin
MPRLLMLCLAIACTGAFAETYHWVDSSGQTVISDTPPSGKARNVVKTEDSQTGSDLPFAVRKASKDFPVTLYTGPNCSSECKQARDLLNGRGIPFSEKMLKTDEDIEELKKLIGDAFVPSLKVGKETSRGMNASGYHNLLDIAGYPKTASYKKKTSDSSNPKP